ncbi:MAG TPA: hypothetical protein ACFYD7_13705 [Candidatus Wujingus californicus]|uniref:hypothetical protein n=1 Tax=Candidatus Wujingus californicus TaxID=3367618 RepID=UPI004026E1AE
MINFTEKIKKCLKSSSLLLYRLSYGEKQFPIIESGARSQKSIPTLAAACPFCLSMFEDARKFKNVEQSINSLDIAEIVVQGSNL